jgi:WhiB family transcriptional regulator, redox-sensing transcriptional regulator
MSDESWGARALCAEVGGDLWHPKKGDPATKAKQICAACPVVHECLQFALESREPSGVWGGKTRTERRRILKRGEAA